MTDSLRIFCHLTVKKFVCTAVRIVYSIKTAGSDATAAAFAFIIIDHCFFVYICNRITATFFCTATAATTDFFVDRRFSACMLLHLSCTASAAHTDVFQCTAESGSLMTFEMSQTYKNVCIHDRMSDKCGLAVFSIYNRNFYFIGSAKSVANDNLTACRNCIKSIQICTVQMFQCVFSASRIQCIAVCQKRHTTLLFTQICYYFGIVRT